MSRATVLPVKREWRSISSRSNASKDHAGPADHPVHRVQLRGDLHALGQPPVAAHALEHPRRRTRLADQKGPPALDRRAVRARVVHLTPAGRSLARKALGFTVSACRRALQTSGTALPRIGKSWLRRDAATNTRDPHTAGRLSALPGGRPSPQQTA